MTRAETAFRTVYALADGPTIRQVGDRFTSEPNTLVTPVTVRLIALRILHQKLAAIPHKLGPSINTPDTAAKLAEIADLAFAACHPTFETELAAMAHAAATTPELYDVVGASLNALLAEDPDLAATIAEVRS